MKKLLLTAFLILGLGGLSFAYTSVNTGRITPSYQKAQGGLLGTTAGLTAVSVGSTVITGIMVTSGSTANPVQFWDASTNVATSGQTNVLNNASTVFEANTAANTTTFYDLSQTPIRTVNGLEASSAALTGGGYIVYTIQYP